MAKSKILKFNENIVRYKSICKKQIPLIQEEIKEDDFMLGGLEFKIQEILSLKEQLLMKKNKSKLKLKALNKLKKSLCEEDLLAFIDINIEQIKPKLKNKFEINNDIIVGYLTQKYGENFGSYLKYMLEELDDSEDD